MTKRIPHKSSNIGSGSNINNPLMGSAGVYVQKNNKPTGAHQLSKPNKGPYTIATTNVSPTGNLRILCSNTPVLSAQNKVATHSGTTLHTNGYALTACTLFHIAVWPYNTRQTNNSLDKVNVFSNNKGSGAQGGAKHALLTNFTTTLV